MKHKSFLTATAVFIIMLSALMCIAGCSGGSGKVGDPLSGWAASIIGDISGYVYAPAEGQGKKIKAAQNTGLIASSSQLNDGNYVPVRNATVKREDSSTGSTQTDSNGAFTFSNLSAAGEYNIVVDPSTSTNASSYAGIMEHGDGSLWDTSLDALCAKARLALS